MNLIRIMPVEENATLDSALRWGRFCIRPPNSPHIVQPPGKGVKEPMFKKVMITVVPLILMFMGTAATAGEAEPFVTLMTHDSFAVGEETLKAFEQEAGVKLKIIKTGDAGAALSQAILSKKNPLADVFFGVDNTFLSRALKAGIFAAYSSPMLGKIPKELRLDSHNRLLPVDFGMSV